MDPIELALLTSGALGAIGLLRRGATPVSGSGQAVMRARVQMASPILQGTQHLPWPLRPLTSSVVTLTTAVVSNQLALVADGASTVLDAARHSIRGAAQPGTTQPDADTRLRDRSRGRSESAPDVPDPVPSGRGQRPQASARAGGAKGRSSRPTTRRTTKQSPATKAATSKSAVRKSASKRSSST